jgi:hypothetical protein
MERIEVGCEVMNLAELCDVIVEYDVFLTVLKFPVCFWNIWVTMSFPKSSAVH